MLTKNIFFKNFSEKKKNKKLSSSLKKNFKDLLSQNKNLLETLKPSYINSYKKKQLKNIKISKTLILLEWVVLY